MAQLVKLQIPPFGKRGKLDKTNYMLFKLKMKVILNSYEIQVMVIGVDVMRAHLFNATNLILPLA